MTNNYNYVKSIRSAKAKLPPPDENTFRILISSDNHLGYNEADSIRSNDSFITFEETINIGIREDVDLVLLGGDLFHENSPSRNTMVKTMQIFRDSIFGDRPISFEIVSDCKNNFSDRTYANYEDPNFNIALPVFIIHGNHDDPAGFGEYSAVDQLSKSNLLNYFGKQKSIDDIEMIPILLQKGTTKIALYGLGNIRDERLHRTFKANKVKWHRPVEDADEYFNIFVIHQNRYRHSIKQKNYIKESMLPTFLDLVIWGHEHECLITPTASETNDFQIIQPGSSVATSLSTGEAVKKCTGILEIRNNKHRMTKFTLKTVRPFVMEDLNLSDHLNDYNPKIPEVEDFLAERIYAIIKDTKENSRSELLPLIRLRVDYTNFPRLNVTRFGQRFVGEVANPADIILFHKKRKKYYI